MPIIETDPTKRNNRAETEVDELRKQIDLLTRKKSEYEKAIWEIDTEISTAEAQIANILCSKYYNKQRRNRNGYSRKNQK